MADDVLGDAHGLLQEPQLSRIQGHSEPGCGHDPLKRYAFTGSDRMGKQLSGGVPVAGGENRVDQFARESQDGRGSFGAVKNLQAKARP
jgi:hypothetical protein